MERVAKSSLSQIRLLLLLFLLNARQSSSSKMSSTTDLEKKDELQQTSSTPPLSQRGSGAAIPISLACSSSRPHTATATPTLFSVSHSLHHPPPTLSPSTPLTWSHLLRPPLIRQWVLSDVLVRQKGERPAGGFELFLDLVLVAVVSQFAETAGEEDSSWSLFKFGAFFWGAWSIWQDVSSLLALHLLSLLVRVLLYR